MPHRGPQLWARGDEVSAVSLARMCAGLICAQPVQGDGRVSATGPPKLARAQGSLRVCETELWEVAASSLSRTFRPKT